MSRQWRSDDTSRWIEGFGRGIYGDMTITANQNFFVSNGVQFGAGNKGAPTYSTINGTSGNLSATTVNRHGWYTDWNTNGEPCLIHQTRGTGAGNWELNIVSAFPTVTGTQTTTFLYPLQNSYVTSGNSVAQVVKIPQYNNFTINGGATLSVPNWDGTRFGIFPLLVRNTLTIGGSLNASAKGYIGSKGGTGSADGGEDGAPARQGEGTVGPGGLAGRNDPSNHHLANGNGGGAGDYKSDTRERCGGGGGGHATGGSNGQQNIAGERGRGGNSAGSAELTTAVFGGAGGGGGGDLLDNPSVDNSVAGGYGGGIVFLFSKEIVITGNIAASGSAGQNAIKPSGSKGWSAGGGGGAGGSVLMKAEKASIGTNKIVASGAIGGTSPVSAAGGTGSVGRIHLDYSVSYSGATSPTINTRLDSTIRPLLGGSFLFNML